MASDTLILTEFGARTETIEWFCGYFQALNRDYDFKVYGGLDRFDGAAAYIALPQPPREDVPLAAHALALALTDNRHYRKIIHIGSDCWIRDIDVIRKMEQALDRYCLVGIAEQPVHPCFFGLQTQVLGTLSADELLARLAPPGQPWFRDFARELFTRYPCAGVSIPASQLVCYAGLEQAIECLELFLKGKWESLPTGKEHLLQILRFVQTWLRDRGTRLTLDGRAVDAAVMDDLIRRVEVPEFLWREDWTGAHKGQPAPEPQPAIAGARRRLLFCINSGRSGSEYLAQLLGTARDVYAFHEPEPLMTGRYLRIVLERDPGESLSERSIKARAIRQRMTVLPPEAIYAETSHMFIKTFADVVMEAFADHDVEVIVLRRYLPSVLMSFITMGYYSDRNPAAWHAWMHTPGTGHCVFQPPPFDGTPDQYDLAIGYLLDIEARAQKFRERYPGCRVHEVRLEGLQTPDEIRSFFKRLRLEPTERTWELAGARINVRSQRKAQFGIETTLEHCEQRLRQYLQRCRDHGIAVPALPQMAP